jgi:hypothetical protein
MFRENPAPLPLCARQMSHGLPVIYLSVGQVTYKRESLLVEALTNSLYKLRIQFQCLISCD